MSDPVEDGRLADLDEYEPLFVNLIWDDDSETWTVSTNADADVADTTVATALSAVLYAMACGEMTPDE